MEQIGSYEIIRCYLVQIAVYFGGNCQNYFFTAYTQL